MSESKINYKYRVRLKGVLGEVELETDYDRRSFAANEKSLDDFIDASIKAYKSLENKGASDE